MKIRCALIFIALVFIINLAYADANTKKIGILLWNDQPRYLQNTQGVKDYLKQHGYGEPNVKFTIDNAGGNKLKALESSRKYIDAKMDMVITVGTSATVIASNEIKNIPLVFVMVWDPVESKVANDWKSSGNNTTGASSKTSTTKLLSALQEFGNVKRVAVLYTPGERNSEIQLQEFEAEKDSFNFTIIPVPLSNNNMVAPILSDVVKRVDAIYLAGSSVVGDNLTTIVDIATKANVITASQSEDLVERGALMGITVDPYAVGKLAGEKALKILKGAKPSAIPIEPLSKLDLIINMRTAKAGKFSITQDFMKKVSRKIE